ncbi:DUF6153 family protein [Nocardioides alkalitolerans]|uniref:DUF6153 family protein n=1 Tax=Nocardioides alkalitolerans TaxID=281714 RepID=UPI00041126F6|nr:DUF6153 family protein [Nocardioides alkalitolerans]
MTRPTTRTPVRRLLAAVVLLGVLGMHGLAGACLPHGTAGPPDDGHTAGTHHALAAAVATGDTAGTAHSGAGGHDAQASTDEPSGAAHLVVGLCLAFLLGVVVLALLRARGSVVVALAARLTVAARRTRTAARSWRAPPDLVALSICRC